MREVSCSQESAVARATRSGAWNAGLEAHLRECANCRSVRAAAAWMQEVAQRQGAEVASDLPDPQILWLRAQIRERQGAAERAFSLLQWAEIAPIALACAGLGVWIMSSWNTMTAEIAEAVNWTLFEAWPALGNSLYEYGPTNAPILASSALALVSLIVAGIAYPLLVRE